MRSVQPRVRASTSPPEARKSAWCTGRESHQSSSAEKYASRRHRPPTRPPCRSVRSAHTTCIIPPCERRRRQVGGVVEVARRVVGPPVPHDRRPRHAVAPHDDGVAHDLRVGPGEPSAPATATGSGLPPSRPRRRRANRNVTASPSIDIDSKSGPRRPPCSASRQAGQSLAHVRLASPSREPHLADDGSSDNSATGRSRTAGRRRGRRRPFPATASSRPGTTRSAHGRRPTPSVGRRRDPLARATAGARRPRGTGDTRRGSALALCRPRRERRTVTRRARRRRPTRSAAAAGRGRRSTRRASPEPRAVDAPPLCPRAWANVG